MAVHIPQCILDQSPLVQGLNLRHQGKVRDSYSLNNRAVMGCYASDRISIFDFVLPELVPYKGEYLTALSHFHDALLRKHGFNTDFVAGGADIDAYLPASLQDNPELQRRMTIVKLLPATDTEDIIRFALTGNGWKAYQKNGSVCGHVLPPGLRQGELLSAPLYTPTTKEDGDHDQDIDFQVIRQRYPGREEYALRVAQLMHDLALEKNLVLGDSKFELTWYEGKWYVMDEKATADSSRYWDKAEWIQAIAKNRMPAPYDKQFTRDFGIEVGVETRPSGEKRSPKNTDDLAFVDNLEIPPIVIGQTQQRYDELFYRRTEMTLAEYQREIMHIEN